MCFLFFSFTDSHHFLAEVKIEGQLSDATGETIEDLRKKLADWLSLERHLIRFNYLEEGCIAVSFELPKRVLATSQEKAKFITQAHSKPDSDNDSWLADVISISFEDEGLSIEDEGLTYVNTANIGKNIWYLDQTYIFSRKLLMDKEAN